MTRETKVGLVVGTGIILLIGIIVSDHLSSNGRTGQTPAPPGYVNDGNTGGTGGARVINPRGHADVDTNNAGRATPVPPADQGNMQNSSRPGIEIARVDPNNPDRAATDGGTGNAGRVIVPPANAGNAADNANNASNNNNAGAATHGGTGDRNLDAALRNQGFLDPNTGANNNAGNANTGNNASNAGNTGNAAGSPLVRTPEPIIHYVKPGERLWGIAETHYGHGKYWTVIAKHNADKLVDAATGSVRENVRLVFPAKSVVVPEASGAATNNLTHGGIATGNTGNGNAAGNTSNGANNAHSHGAAPASGLGVKVESGDNLTRIAERFYRSTDYAYVKAIVEANRDQIQDADDIKAGMTLKMPEIGTRGNNAGDGRATNSNSGNTGNNGNGNTNGGNVAVPRHGEAAPRPTPVVKTYKVESGDTFSSIAREKLGNANRWKELATLNRGTVPNANALREGIVLLLPADAR